jgi:hypothetical protein
MTIETTVTTKATKEIELPYFFEHACTKYAVYSEDNVRSAFCGEGYQSVDKRTAKSENFKRWLCEGAEITEEQFNETYQKALAIINAPVNDDIIIGVDGNMYYAHRKDFVNLQESVAGFGATPERAVDDLKFNENHSL